MLKKEVSIMQTMRRTVVCTTEKALVLSSLKEPLRRAYFSICMQHSSSEDETFINLSKRNRIFLDCTYRAEKLYDIYPIILTMPYEFNFPVNLSKTNKENKRISQEFSMP